MTLDLGEIGRIRAPSWLLSAEGGCDPGRSHPPGYLRSASLVGSFLLSPRPPVAGVIGLCHAVRARTGPLRGLEGFGHGVIIEQRWCHVASSDDDDPDTPPLIPSGSRSRTRLFAGCWALHRHACYGPDGSGDDGTGTACRRVPLQEACPFLVDGCDVAPVRVPPARYDVGKRVSQAIPILTKDEKFFLPRGPQMSRTPGGLNFTGLADGRRRGEPTWRRPGREAMRGRHAHGSARGRASRPEKRTAAEAFEHSGRAFGFFYLERWRRTPGGLFDDEQTGLPSVPSRPFLIPEYPTAYTYGGPTALWSEAGWQDSETRPPRLGEHDAKWALPSSTGRR